jgi:hypothetical protein
MITRLMLSTAILPIILLAGPTGAQQANAETTTRSIQLSSGPAPVQFAEPNARSTTAPASVPFTISYERRLTIHADRTATDVVTKRIKILAPSAISGLSQQSETYMDGMETLEIVEAFTEKADGTRVRVEPANILTHDAAGGLEATFARDLKQRTVIFPDVEAGDTLVLTRRKEMLSGLFPGQFFYAEAFPRNQPLTSAQIVIDAPVALNLQVRTQGRPLTDQVEDTGTTRRHTVTAMPQEFMLLEERAVTPIDTDPLLLVSTFKSYIEMGEAYAHATLAKARPSPEITALAQEVTRGISDRRQQAMAIDAWMKKNIRYVAVYLGAGRVVPNDAAPVLHNKYGDCKDKATLMSALLAAKGIASEQVLINFGNTYTLPDPPTMAALNHAILYLPEFDLYDDPTAQFASFGVLMPENYDKPVVRISGAGVKLSRTPVMKPQDHVAYAHTSINVAADGTVTGSTTERNTGVFGIILRMGGAKVQNAGSDNAARLQLQSLRTPGSGHYDIGNANETADPSVISSRFTLDGRFSVPAQGGRATMPVGLPLTARPGNFLPGLLAQTHRLPFTCYAGRQVEDIDMTFDPALPMPIVPGPLNVENSGFSYQATFATKDRTLKVHSEFVSLVDHQVCDPAFDARIRGVLGGVVFSDMNAGFEFRHPESTEPKPAAIKIATASGNIPTSSMTVGAAAAPKPSAPSPTGSVSAAAAAPAASAPSTVHRYMVAGQTLRIDFITSINPDCTSVGYATVRPTNQPQHGTLKIENTTGFTTFPADNIRAECNKRRSDGVALTYEPEADYTGSDTIDVDVIFASDSFRKIRYAIEVR